MDFNELVGHFSVLLGNEGSCAVPLNLNMCGHKYVFLSTENFYFKYIERVLLDLDVCFYHLSLWIYIKRKIILQNKLKVFLRLLHIQNPTFLNFLN